MAIRLGLLLLFLSPAFAAERPVTLLILPFKNSTENAELDAARQGFSDLVTAALNLQSPAVQVVDHEQLERILAEQGLKRDSLMAESSTFRLGHLVQARYILRGSFIAPGDRPRVRAFLYQTETTQLVKSFQSSEKTLAQSAEVIAAAVRDALKDPSAMAVLPTDLDPTNSSHFMRGLSFCHQGEYLKAIPEFTTVLTLNPHQADAKYWLVKSYIGANLRDHAALEAQEFLALFPKDPRCKEMLALKS